MAAIADTAGVSVETIYLSIGGKATLVRFLIETALSGTDEPVPPHKRKGVNEIHAERDAQRKLELFARMVRPMLERLAPISQVVVEAAPADSELSSLVAELQQRHAGSMRLVVEHLSEAGCLRQSISKEIARDVMWAMNSPEFYRLLVIGRGWTGEMFEKWLADAWQRLLLDNAAARAPNTSSRSARQVAPTSEKGELSHVHRTKQTARSALERGALGQIKLERRRRTLRP
jgi:AcrR family transcriptional regulator